MATNQKLLNAINWLQSVEEEQIRLKAAAREQVFNLTQTFGDPNEDGTYTFRFNAEDMPCVTYYGFEPETHVISAIKTKGDTTILIINDFGDKHIKIEHISLSEILYLLSELVSICNYLDRTSKTHD